MKLLYIKTFSGLSGIVYEKTTNRPARGILTVGLILLVVSLAIIFLRYSHQQQLPLLIVACVMFLVGFVPFVLRMQKLGADIGTASVKQMETLETSFSFDGGSGFFPFSPFVGVIIGIVIFQILGRYWNLHPVGIGGFIVGIIMFGAACLLAVGITYAFWEYKFDRTIVVYKYHRTGSTTDNR